MRFTLTAAAALVAADLWAADGLRPVAPGEARWTLGFWKVHFDRCRTATVPYLWRTMNGTEPSHYLVNFLVAAGQTDGRHRGAAFNDGDFYKTLEAACRLYAVTRDADVLPPIDAAVRAIRAAQRPDGYLHTRIQIRQKQGEAAAPFRDPLQFEAYCLGHLLTTACVHHRATGKSDLLDVARKAADCLERAAAEPTPEFLRCAVCPSHYMGLVELARETREPRYRQLAKHLIDLRDRVQGGTDDNQDRVPLREQMKAVGHAVRANYLYAGVADLLHDSPDESLRRPLFAVWDNVVSEKLAITGGCGALYDGASPDGSRDQRSIGRVHQAYGRDYQLPQATAHNETCAAVGLVLWSWRMLQTTGDVKYADVLEQTLTNAVLAGVGLDGKTFFYTNPLRQADPRPVELRWGRGRQSYFGSFCCPPNVARTIAASADYAYGVSPNTVWVHLYGGGGLSIDMPDGPHVRLTQTTEYPWDGRVRITVGVEKPAAFALRLRVPAWARGATLAVNGRPFPAPEPGRYAAIDRTWSDGDDVTLNLPMEPVLVEAHPLVEEARNQVAVRRGPIVFCLESLDLPNGVALQDVVLPANIMWKPTFDANLLGGVVVLDGRAAVRPAQPWGRELYRERRSAAATPVDVRLIPYYAWANRGPSEMSVWLPLGQ
jgi:DUF1680 family protein